MMQKAIYSLVQEADMINLPTRSGVPIGSVFLAPTGCERSAALSSTFPVAGCFQSYLVGFVLLGICSQVISTSVADEVNVNTRPPVRRIQSRTDYALVEKPKLILTPQSDELSEVAEKAFVALLDQALFNYAQLSQSLAVNNGMPEQKISNVSSRLQSQMVNSVFVLGAADAYQNLVGGNRARSLLRGDTNISQPNTQRTLEADPAGAIVSSLELSISMSFNLGETEPEAFSVPSPNTYLEDFFAVDSATSTSFISAAQEIRDEFGRKPLSRLRYIGIGEAVLWKTPYAFIEEKSQYSGFPDVQSRSGNGAAKASIDSDFQQSLPWMAIAIVFSFIAVAVIIGALIFVLHGARNRETITQKILEEIAQNENCAVGISGTVGMVQEVTSPITQSFEDVSYLSGSNQVFSKEDSKSYSSVKKRKKLENLGDSSEGNEGFYSQHPTRYKNHSETIQRSHFTFSSSHHDVQSSDVSVNNGSARNEAQQESVALSPNTNRSTLRQRSHSDFSVPGSNPILISSSLRSDRDRASSTDSEISQSKNPMDYENGQEAKNKENSKPPHEPSDKSSVSWTGTLTTFLTNAAAGLQGSEDQKQQDYAYFSVEKPKSPRRVRSDNLYVIPEDDASL